MDMYDYDEPAIAWTAMPYRATVVMSDGSKIGTAESLLGDEEDDIFHGIAVQTSGHVVEIPADHIKKITANGVLTDLDEAGVAQLEPYREEKWFGIGWGGLFQKRPEWKPKSGA